MIHFQDYSTVATIKTVKVVVKNVPDYSASREKNDLGFLTFDLQVSKSYTVFTSFFVS
jgi:signal peptidase complex subunit 3